MWVGFGNRNGKHSPIKDINSTIRELSKNVYYVISGMSSTGVTFYYRKDNFPTYAPNYRHACKYKDFERAKKEAKDLKDGNQEFFRIIDLTTLCVLEIAEDITKTVKM